MMSRTLALGLVSTAFVVAAAGGSYLAVRQNTAAVEPAAAVQAAPAPAAVQETEAVVTPPTPVPAATPAVEREERRAAPERKAPERTRPRPKAAAARPAAKAATPVATSAPEAVSATAPPAESPAVPALPVADPPPVAAPAPPAEPVYVEVVVPATSVIGLEIETTVSTERARVEDRVDARVTRDVFVDGRVAIPAGSRVIGAVTVVVRGG
jgi:hypothetical protein